MKLRHVRAIAVFSIAVLALTGARGRGGSCDDSSGSSGGSSFGGSSSSSSTSGGSSYDSSTSGGYTSGDTTTGSSTTSGSTTGGYTTGDTSSTSTSTSTSTSGSSTSGYTSGSRGDANITDVRIDRCEYDPSRGIVAAVSATNSSSSENYTYTFTVTFTDPSGTTVGTRHPSFYMVLAGRTEKLDVATPYVAQSGATSGGKCTLSNVRRMAG
ncbi:hypothetical protein AR457_20075 [Streptomyces agglomeratus]|uniref:Uncharacterized protein n=1 Tax=Streptomyces agglomeratus TaxID=285458 RepID=A0A1E5PA23_9ACTN|nr:hypothetical protein AS594_19840 [Streptomyces agglomeratus]OEJ39534.1 hypothetical protein BGK70_16575 [Streptomyces agglomeratus]OEJ46081.1 hypothetical protein AR457_20075 [Streptomyces agglomeratus]OEJ52099.1 hypothetical protein BGK72_16270 [Streptomyces agglomeratus]OEJ59455.1 hypothetical protein BGM19_17115 [Streptomyces agglomeratus]